MSVQVHSQSIPALTASQAQPCPWSFPLRIAFRFSVLYLGLYCLVTQIFGGLLPIPVVEFPELGILPPLRNFVFWTAQHMFGYKQPLVYTGSGSGDKVFDWVQVVCLLVLALAGTCIWWAVDRRRVQYNVLYRWFRVFIRFALAGQLFNYGLVKILPMQMPFPYLARLLEPYGDFSPMGVLWSSIGASPAYERFVGSMEVLAGLLLIIPAASMLGALICVIDATEIFVLNMTYDVPVKLLSFHLLLMAAFLLIPDRSRLMRFCFGNCEVAAADSRRLFASRSANRFATGAQILFGLALFGTSLFGSLQNWYKWGGGVPKSPLYGIWNVDEMAIDGVTRAPLLTDYDRWRRIVFEFPEWVMFERMDDSFGGFGAKLDEKHGTLTVTKRGDSKSKYVWTYRRQNGGRMILDGQFGAHKLHMQLSLMDRNKFLLVNRGFHWIQDYPFNR